MLHALVAVCVLSQAGTADSVGMVLLSKGSVTLERAAGGDEKAGPARAMTLLEAGDQVKLAADADCTVFVFSTQTRQNLKSGHVATLTAEGCQPAEAIETQQQLRKGQDKATPALRKLCKSGTAATIVARSSKTPVVLPIPGGRVLTDRPDFQWKSVETDRRAARVEVVSSTGEPVWSVAAGEDRALGYPEDADPLPRGRKYTWRVVTESGENLFEADFFVTGEKQAAQLEEVAALARSRDAADRLLAATLLHASRFHGEALAIYEKLAEAEPKQPMLQRALADCYAAAGFQEDAERARKRARPDAAN